MYTCYSKTDKNHVRFLNRFVKNECHHSPKLHIFHHSFSVGSDLFLEPDIHSCLSSLLHHFSSLSLDFTFVIPGLPSFHDLWVNLIQSTTSNWLYSQILIFIGAVCSCLLWWPIILHIYYATITTEAFIIIPKGFLVWLFSYSSDYNSHSYTSTYLIVYIHVHTYMFWFFVN